MSYKVQKCFFIKYLKERVRGRRYIFFFTYMTGCKHNRSKESRCSHIPAETAGWMARRQGDVFEETTVRGAEKKKELQQRRRRRQRQLAQTMLSEVRQGVGRQVREARRDKSERESCIMRVCDGGLSLTLHVVSREPQRSEAESEVK